MFCQSYSNINADKGLHIGRLLTTLLKLIISVGLVKSFHKVDPEADASIFMSIFIT